MKSILDLISNLSRSSLLFGGVDVVVTDYLPCEREFRQVRFPKSKKRRIRKKWAANRKQNYRSVDAEPVFVQLDGRILTNKLGWALLQKQIKTP